jgi:phosphatidylethanolamine-binding protein (PEBP) family uncharacterized protein
MRWPATASAFILLTALAGCATGSGEVRLPELAVDYTWKGVPACSNASPRIVVHNAPPGTARYRVEQVDKDSAFARHGGGEVAAPRDGVLPPGAVPNYRGPCPSQLAINYEIRVWALDAAGKSLARGARVETFTPIALIKPGRR